MATVHADLLPHLKIVNVGGGLAIDYARGESTSSPPLPTASDLARALPAPSSTSAGLVLMVEPGRSLVGDAGALVTAALGIKRTAERTFVVVDGSMTELIRPALYGAYHAILPVRRSADRGKAKAINFKLSV